VDYVVASLAELLGLEAGAGRKRAP
jgi:hypothetical protein